MTTHKKPVKHVVKAHTRKVNKKVTVVRQHTRGKGTKVKKTKPYHGYWSDDRIEDEFSEMEQTAKIFSYGERPETLSEMKQASHDAKVFYRLYDKYEKKRVAGKLLPEYVKRLKDLENTDVYDPDDEF